MPATKPSMIRKVIKIAEQHQQMLDEMIEKRGIISESEAIRQAIDFWYEKKSPEYLKPSPKQAEKQKELEEQKRIEQMSDYDYAIEIMKARVLVAKDGTQYAAILTASNLIKFVPLLQIKEFDQSDSWFREEHMKKLASGVDIDVFLKSNVFKNKLSQLGIDLEKQNETQIKTKNQHKWNDQEAEGREAG